MHHEPSVSRLDQCGPRVPPAVLPIFRHKMMNFEIARPTLLVSYPENRLTLGVCLCRQVKKRPYKPGRESVRAHARAASLCRRRAGARNCPAGCRLYAASLYAAYTVAGRAARQFTKAGKSAPTPFGQTWVMAHWSNGGPKSDWRPKWDRATE